ncbi:MAG: GNAT family N-acetyltransferase [Candidatus Nanopelagicaceae bacterium]
MELVTRPASKADVEIVKEIANSNLKSFNPQEKTIGEIEARYFITGFVDPAITRLVKSQESDVWQGFITLNPDKSRSRFYLDIYTLPGAQTLQPSLDLALSLAREHDMNYQLWVGKHSKDETYKSILLGKGFDLLRRYWTMEMELPSTQEYRTNLSTSIREIDLDSEDDLKAFHSVNQDSFSNHFGFMPRAFPEWSELVLRDRDEVNLKVWLLTIDGEDVGFLDCNDELIHEEAGFVAGLGVRKAFQGKGFGEALLMHAVNHYSKLGREKLCLNVDAGNESGALRLYEKLGMTPISEWHQYENPNWSK